MLRKLVNLVTLYLLHLLRALQILKNQCNKIRTELLRFLTVS